MHNGAARGGTGLHTDMRSRRTAIDDTAFEGIRSIMRERFSALIHKYFETGGGYIAQIENGIARENARLVAENAHPLKSSSAALGAHRVAALAARIERAAVSGGNVAALSPLLRQLKSAFREAETELHEKLSF